MSLVSVRPYFRNTLDDLGFSEWTDGFDFENIPENIIDRSYHITTGSINGQSQNQQALDIVYPVTVRVFFHGYRNPAEAIDESIASGEQIICSAVKPSNANGTAIKDVQFISMEPTPKSAAGNDNIVLLELNFEARIFLDPR